MSTEAPSGDQVQNSMETDGSAVNNHNEAGESKKARTDDTDGRLIPGDYEKPLVEF